MTYDEYLEIVQDKTWAISVNDFNFAVKTVLGPKSLSLITFIAGFSLDWG